MGWGGGLTLVVNGTGGNFKAPSKPLYMSNAGTATRFLQSVLTLVGGGPGIVRLQRLHREGMVSEVLWQDLQAGSRGMQKQIWLDTWIEIPANREGILQPCHNDQDALPL